jgi:hypothetical protein
LLNNVISRLGGSFFVARYVMVHTYTSENRSSSFFTKILYTCRYRLWYIHTPLRITTIHFLTKYSRFSPVIPHFPPGPYGPMFQHYVSLLHSGSIIFVILFQSTLSSGGTLQYPNPLNFPPSFFLVSTLRNTLPSTCAGLTLV